MSFFIFQSEIGFGKIESYTKLDKLGEVSINLYIKIALQLSYLCCKTCCGKEN